MYWGQTPSLYHKIMSHGDIWTPNYFGEYNKLMKEYYGVFSSTVTVVVGHL